MREAEPEMKRGESHEIIWDPDLIMPEDGFDFPVSGTKVSFSLKLLWVEFLSIATKNKAISLGSNKNCKKKKKEEE